MMITDSWMPDVRAGFSEACHSNAHSDAPVRVTVAGLGVGHVRSVASSSGIGQMSDAAVHHRSFNRAIRLWSHSMYRRRFITCLAASAMVLAAGCSTTGRQAPESPEERRATIDSNTQAALARLAEQIPGSREFVEDARGILVFPAVISAGLVVGGSYGEGELIVGGEPIDYYDLTAGSVGLLAGADSKALFLLFMDDESLTKFRESRGWTVGADASVSMLDVGASANISSRTVQESIVGFALTNQGLMASISLDGSKVSKLNFD